MQFHVLALTFGLLAIVAGIETHGSPPVEFEGMYILIIESQRSGIESRDML